MFVKVCTYNVRGLNDKVKRSQLFKWLKNENLDLICLQETHCGSIETEKIWKAEWGSPELSSASNLSNKSGGIMILANPKSDIKLIQNVQICQGRVLATKVKIGSLNDKSFYIVNVYAHNNQNERSDLFRQIKTEIENLNVDKLPLFVLGDFNCVTEAVDNMKQNGIRLNNDKSVDDLKVLMCELDLVDAWRKFNPDKQQFTWHMFNSVNPQRSCASRIDKFLVSKEIFVDAKSCQISQTTISDHSPVILTLQNIDSVERGRGVWKMNVSILKSPIFNREVKILYA